jgi:carbon storage regulator
LKERDVLVLSRRVGERIVIGNDVVVTVLEVRGDIVRIGVDAPRSVTVHRSEVIDAIEASERAEAVADSAAANDLAADASGPAGQD